MDTATNDNAPAAELVLAIATKFCENLRRRLSADEMAEVIRRNKAKPSNRICHSHDFCDANVYMGDAFDELGISTLDADGGVTDAACWLWGLAWEAASEAEFNPAAIARAKP